MPTRSRQCVFIASVAGALGALLFGSSVAHGAPGDLIWTRGYAGASGGADTARGVAVDHDGNVCVTGTSYRATTGMDILTIKYSPWGARRWIRRYTSPGRRADTGRDVACDAAGNVYVTGQRRLAAGPGYVTLKYNSAGTQQWIYGYDGPGNGNNCGLTVVPASNGQVYVTGVSWRDAVRKQDILTFKYTAAGARIWSKLFNGAGSGDDFVHDMGRDGSNNVYLAGSQWVDAESDDYLMLSYSPSGALRWQRTYSGTAHGHDAAQAISVGGGYAAATGVLTAAGTHADVATVRVDANNTLQFAAAYDTGANTQDYGNDVVVRGNEVHVTGTSGDNFITMRYGPFGASIYATIDDPSGMVNYEPHIGVNAAGEALLGGSFSSGIDPVGIATMKYNAAGVLQWARLRQSPTTCQSSDLALGPAGALYVVGYQWTADPSTDLTDYLTVKYAQ